MGSPSFIPTFSIADFAQAIAAPYTSFRAYQSGVIDSSGNLKKPESSIDPFEYFVIKMKKIFEEIPPTITKSRLSSYNSAFQLFSEEAKTFGIPFDQFVFFVEGYLTSKFLLTEDMGAGAGGGMATGTSPGDLGVAQEFKNTGQVAGYDKPLPSPMFTRGPVEMFDMGQEEFDQFKSAKAWKNLPDSATKRYLQRFQRRNPSGRMGIRTKRDNGDSDLYWITYPVKSFMEEFGLEGLDILNEEKIMKDDHNNLYESMKEEHGVKLQTALKNMFSVGEDSSGGIPAILKNKAARGGHVAEMQARLLALGSGLDQISSIKDDSEREAKFTEFLDSHVRGSAKSPSASDRPKGMEKTETLPDAFIFDPDTGKVVHSEVKTRTASGSFPTRWPSFGKKLRMTEWQKEGLSAEDLEKAGGAGRYRIKLPPETAFELSKEAGTALVRYGKKSGPKTIIKNAQGHYHVYDTGDVMGHWASSLDFPSVKGRSRGKGVEQSNPETAGHTVELSPLKGFPKPKSGVKSRRLTMSKKAFETIKSATDPMHHEDLHNLLSPHVVE